MKLKDLFESSTLTNKQKFIITAWGQTLYMSYMSLPKGPNMISDPDFNEAINEYLKDPHSDKNIQWVSEACKLPGIGYISKATVDALFKLCQTKAEKDFTLYRYDHTKNLLKNDSWISLTTLPNEYNYGDKKTEYKIPKGTHIVLTHGLADKGEVIMNTTDLNNLNPN